MALKVVGLIQGAMSRPSGVADSVTDATFDFDVEVVAPAAPGSAVPAKTAREAPTTTHTAGFRPSQDTLRLVNANPARS